MNLVALLEAVAAIVAHPLATLGSLFGLFVGMLAAFALHWLFPYQSLAGAQALLLGAGFVAGLVLGHLGDERFVRKK